MAENSTDVFVGPVPANSFAMVCFAAAGLDATVAVALDETTGLLVGALMRPLLLL
jgi:hypothetical protein